MTYSVLWIKLLLWYHKTCEIVKSFNIAVTAGSSGVYACLYRKHNEFAKPSHGGVKVSHESKMYTPKDVMLTGFSSEIRVRTRQ